MGRSADRPGDADHHRRQTKSDVTAAADELPASARKTDLPWDSLYAEALYDTAATIGSKLHRSHPEPVFAADSRLSVGTVGPVTQQYRSTLTPLSDEERRQLVDAPTRRLARLLVSETNVASIRDHGLLERALANLSGLCRDTAPPAGRAHPRWSPR